MNRLFNPVDPGLVAIPGRRFALGDSCGDGDPDERPVAEVEVQPYLLGRYPVTNAEFAGFLSACDGEDDIRACIDIDTEKNPLSLDDGRILCASGYLRHPVSYVCWEGANRYCAWLGDQIGLPCRLPSEAEWQNAAMGPDGFKWSLGNVFAAADYVCGCDAPAQVDAGRPSAYGLHSMTGNVFEWCQDRYHPVPGCSGDDRLDDTSYVIKGGAFILHEPANLRNAKRFSAARESAIGCLGFRVAASGAELSSQQRITP